MIFVNAFINLIWKIKSIFSPWSSQLSISHSSVDYCKPCIPDYRLIGLEALDGNHRPKECFRLYAVDEKKALLKVLH